MSDVLCPECGRMSAGRPGSPCPTDGAPRLSLDAISEDVPRIGQRVDDRYAIVDLLGRGAMGTVFDAVDVVDGTPVALKMLRGARADMNRARRRFMREVKVAAVLKSRYAVGVLDWGVTGDNQPYMVMERLEGRSLRQQLVAEGALGIRLAVDLTLDVLDALAEIHGLGLVHRDIKPSNIMLVQADDRLEARLLDFGVAKVIDSIAITDESLTGAGTVGTPQYMAPEQIRRTDVGPPTDIYALGCVLFEMLTGESPFGGRRSRLEVISAHLEAPVPPLPLGVPLELSRLVGRTLAKAPSARPANAEMLAAALHDLRPGLSVAPYVEPMPTPTALPVSATLADTTLDQTAADTVDGPAEPGEEE